MRICKALMGLWRNHRDRGETHRTVWSQRTETGEEKMKASPEDIKRHEQVETRAGPEKTDQVEFRKV